MRALDTGRLYLVASGVPVNLSRGEPIAGELAWRSGGVSHVPYVRAERTGVTLLPTVPLYYVDEARGEVGFVDIEGAPSLGMHWLRGPAVPDEVVGRFTSALATTAPKAPAPAKRTIEVVEAAPRAVLRLRALEPRVPGASLHRFGELFFDYAGIRVPAADVDDPFATVASDKAVHVVRAWDEEEKLSHALRQAGFTRLFAYGTAERERWVLPSEVDWLMLLSERAAVDRKSTRLNSSH